MPAIIRHARGLPDDASRVLAAARSALAVIDTARDQLAAEIRAWEARRVRPPVTAPADLIPLKVAAAAVGRSPECVRRWAIEHKLGVLAGKRWLISRRGLVAYLGAAAPASLKEDHR